MAFPSTKQAQQLSRGKRMCKSLNSLLARKHSSPWWSLRVRVQGSEILYFQSWAHSSTLHLWGMWEFLWILYRNPIGATLGFAGHTNQTPKSSLRLAKLDKWLGFTHFNQFHSVYKTHRKFPAAVKPRENFLLLQNPQKKKINSAVQPHSFGVKKPK